MFLSRIYTGIWFEKLFYLTRVLPWLCKNFHNLYYAVKINWLKLHYVGLPVMDQIVSAMLHSVYCIDKNLATL